MDKEHILAQGIAVFCIVFGALCAGLGSRYSWPDLATLGAGITGAGIQAFTSQIRQTLTNKSGGTVNLTGPAESDAHGS